MDFLKELWHYIGRHKYMLTVAAFFVIICFLDKNNMFVRLRNQHEINRLNAQIESYRSKCDSLEKELNELNCGGKALETIAREQYGMHEENEEVFIIK